MRLETRVIAIAIRIYCNLRDRMHEFCWSNGDTALREITIGIFKNKEIDRILKIYKHWWSDNWESECSSAKSRLNLIRFFKLTFLYERHWKNPIFVEKTPFWKKDAYHFCSKNSQAMRNEMLETSFIACLKVGGKSQFCALILPCEPIITNHVKGQRYAMTSSHLDINEIFLRNRFHAIFLIKCLGPLAYKNLNRLFRWLAI